MTDLQNQLFNLAIGLRRLDEMDRAPEEARRSLEELRRWQALCEIAGRGEARSEQQDRLREIVWHLQSGFENYVRESTATPCGGYVLAMLIQDALSQAQITTGSFSQFVDKDRVGQFLAKIQQAAEQARIHLSPEDKQKADLFIRYQSEAKEFGLLVALQQEYLCQQEAINGRDGAVRKLDELRQRHSKFGTPPPAPSTPAQGVGCLFLLAAAGCFFGSLTIDAVSNLARVWTWLGVCAVLAVVGAGLLKKRKTSEEARREQEKRKAFEKEKAELESEIEQARQQLDLAERAIGSFDPQHTKGEKKLRALTVERERLLKEHGYDGIVDVQVMEAEKSERESFVHQFAQDNHLPGHRAVAALRWEPDDGPDERFHDAVGALMTLSFTAVEALELGRKAQTALGSQTTVEDLVRACLRQ